MCGQPRRSGPTLVGSSAGALVQWLKLPAWKVDDRGLEPHSGLQVLKKQNVSSALTPKKINIVGSLRDRELACSASDRQGSNFKSCVWRAMSSHSSHDPQEVLQAQFSLYVYKGGPKTPFIHFIWSGVEYHTCSHSFILISIYYSFIFGLIHSVISIYVPSLIFS